MAKRVGKTEALKSWEVSQEAIGATRALIDNVGLAAALKVKPDLGKPGDVALHMVQVLRASARVTFESVEQHVALRVEMDKSKAQLGLKTDAEWCKAAALDLWARGQRFVDNPRKILESEAKLSRQLARKYSTLNTLKALVESWGKKTPTLIQLAEATDVLRGQAPGTTPPDDATPKTPEEVAAASAKLSATRFGTAMATHRTRLTTMLKTALNTLLAAGVTLATFEEAIVAATRSEAQHRGLGSVLGRVKARTPQGKGRKVETVRVA